MIYLSIYLSIYLYIYIYIYVYIYVYVNICNFCYLFIHFFWYHVPGITTNSWCMKTNLMGGFVLIIQSICFFRTILLATDLITRIPSWKSSFVYFTACLHDTLNDILDSCLLLTSIIKWLHSETFKVDLRFFGILLKHSNFSGVFFF